MITIPEQVVEETKNYRAKVEELKKGMIEPERFKPYRVSMGIYEQRENDIYMVRTRIPSGVINLTQLKKINELAKKYAHGYVHLTTRQDIQFHKVTLDDTVNILEGLLEVGVVTRGTGGNTARNVGCSPLSGLSKDDVFDVTPYALATTEYLLNDPTSLNLPRKFKIAYSNSPKDTGNATFADLGFVAKILNGEKGFMVYGAGGLGGSPNAAIKLEEFIPATEVLYHVQAMKELFEEEGDRTNKHRARIRFILKRLGSEKFRDRYQELIETIKSTSKLDVFFKDQKPSKSIGEHAIVTSPLIYEQKQEGYYAVYIHPENGNLDAEDLDKIVDFIAQLPYEPSLRLGNTQGFFVRNLKGSDAEKLLDLIQEFISAFDVDNSIACAGASTCKLGLALSQNLLSAIRDKFSEVNDTLKSELPRIFISGCPNSCGQHQKGEIGLFGRARRVEDGLVPLYSILFGGAVGVGKTVLGTDYGAIPAKKIPEFLYQLANLKHQSEVKNFTEFINRETASINSLMQKFSAVEREAENPDLYYDFGSKEKFSFKGRGPGECGAGVMDVIKLDISNAQSAIEEFSKSEESFRLYEAGVSAARALLILKGVDTTKDRLIFNEFMKHFVDTGYVKAEIKGVIEHLLDYKLGDLDSLKNHDEDVKYLVARVSAMYETLSPKLEISIPKEDSSEEVQGPETDVSFRIVDLKGVKCPINFVKAKIELANIKSAETMGFILDHGEPIENVPRSLQSEGHEVIKIDDNYEGSNLLVIRKK